MPVAVLPRCGTNLTTEAEADQHDQGDAERVQVTQWIPRKLSVHEWCVITHRNCGPGMTVLMQQKRNEQDEQIKAGLERLGVEFTQDVHGQ